MDYLARESAPFSPEIWEEIDQAVIETAKKHLVCRRFLSIYGPLGPGTAGVTIDDTVKAEEFIDGVATVSGRRLIELPQLYEDFVLLWRDLEESEKNGAPLDLSAARAAAQKSACREDDLILFGDQSLGMEGLMNAQGANKITRGDWQEGENAFRDVAAGVAILQEKHLLGRYALALSPDLYLDLQRIQPGLGMTELKRVSKLLDGRVYPAGVFGTKRAVLVCAEPQYLDLAIGADLSVGYLELKDFNHCFRILETAALRIKNPESIVVFE